MKSGVLNVSATIAARAAASAAALALSSTLAWGTGDGGGGSFAGSAQVQVEGEIESECHFTTAPSTVTVAPFVLNQTSGTSPLGFQCNFATTRLITIKVKSTNGALKRDGGGDTVAYAVNWTVQSDPDASGYPNDGRNPATFELQSGTSVSGWSGDFSVTVKEATNTKPAGTYKDTLTFEICP